MNEATTSTSVVNEWRKHVASLPHTERVACERNVQTAMRRHALFGDSAVPGQLPVPAIDPCAVAVRLTDIERHPAGNPERCLGWLELHYDTYVHGIKVDSNGGGVALLHVHDVESLANFAKGDFTAGWRKEFKDQWDVAACGVH